MTFVTHGPRARARDASRSSRFSLYLLANLGLLVLALILGGASRENAWAAAIVELASLAMLPWALMRLSDSSQLQSLRWPLAIMGLTILIPIIQLIPLPVSVWTSLPGGARIKAIYDTVGIALPARPLSLTPEYTLRSGLYLVTPIAVFLAWADTTYADRRKGVMAILAALAAGLLLGGVQVSSGGSSLGYLYSNTNLGSLVGFFSNRNHEASLLLCAFPLAASLLSYSRDKERLKPAKLIIGAGLVLAGMLALVAVHSRAGILLLGPILVGSLMIFLRSSGLADGARGRIILVSGAIGLIALTLVVWLGLGPILERFDNSASNDLRFAAAPTVYKLALSHLPLGAGLGSFDSLYRSVEPLSLLTPPFFNHAHDDFLEIFLETGVLGIGVLILFIAWWGFRSYKAWKSNHRSYAALAQAGCLVVAVLTIHSAVDYPMRTLALSAVFGFSCALMIRPKV